MLGIYIHIPFCIKKCNYCAFLSAPADEATRERYVQALIREIELCKEFFTHSDKCKESFTSDRINTVYFGGGTPSVLSTDQLERIMNALRGAFDIAEAAEITLEANPGTLGRTENDVKNTLHRYKEIGFNRLSMGVQSMDNDILKFIGRIHTAEDVERDYRIAREVGFDNINLDLIFSLPNSNKEQALTDLNRLIELGPEHISCYSLQIEEGTPFGKLYDEGKLNEISDEEDRETYHEVCRMLTEAGYEHYEISNFGRPGKHSRHNSSYWNMSDYVGLGLGASGFENGVRYRNISDLNEYIGLLTDGNDDRSSVGAGITRNDLREESHVNTEHDNISEAVFTGLRRSEGIRYSELPKGVNTSERFWQYYKDEKIEADGFVQSGHLIVDGEGMRLTESGIDISNRIMALFV